MSFSFNLLADPGFVAGLKQDASSYVYEKTSWSGTTQPIVENGGGYTNSSYSPVEPTGTVTVNQFPVVGRIGDELIFSGGYRIKLTTAIDTPTTSSQALVGKINGPIAAGETIVKHVVNVPKWVTYPKDTKVKRDGRIDLVAVSNYDASKHNLWGGGVQYVWNYSRSLYHWNPQFFQAGFGYTLASSDSNNGDAQQASWPSEDIRNVMTPDARTTVLQMRDFGRSFDRGEHQTEPDNKGGYWWVEGYLYDQSTPKVVKEKFSSPNFFLEIED